MIAKLEIAGVHTEVDDKLKKYVGKKIGQLDHYLPRQVRPSLHAAVKLKEGKADDKNGCTCEVIMHLPHEELSIAESTVNMYAAIDIVETKLKLQLKKYKDLHASPRLHQRFAAKLRRR